MTKGIRKNVVKFCGLPKVEDFNFYDIFKNLKVLEFTSAVDSLLLRILKLEQISKPR